MYYRALQIGALDLASLWAIHRCQRGRDASIHASGPGRALLEFAPWKIRVNAVAPGHCLTPMPLQFDSPEVIAAKEQTIPLKRYGQPEDMATAISYLASSAASFVTGQVISPNGGFQMT